ncbi:MAG: hypothetical protein QOJ02_3047 [Acidobacteriota bacterium]|jgi:hypothetical protein|nr:hypothetical protein [Acidobacteriota bacterium]
MPRHLNKLLSIAICALVLLAGESLCTATGRAPGAQELKKAEKVLAKLSELQTASADPDAYQRAVRKLYPNLFINVASLPEGDLKTDLSTAAFLYQQAHGIERGGEMADCVNEVRGLYRSLCLKRGNPTRAQLLLAKAQLHTNWAEALVRFYRGNTDALTVATISEIEKERSIDLKLAESAVAIIRTLDAEVNSYSSVGEFEEHNAVARVSFDKLSKDFEATGGTAQQLLSSLPRNQLYYHLQNALNSYSDGLFWWEKTHARREAPAAVVSVNNWTEPAPEKPLGLDVEMINYTVVSNWRKARKHIATAWDEIERARNNRPTPETTAKVFSK